MHKIKEIRLKNFKFFYGLEPIPFDRKHVLLYGENGSGKSSIYWALFTFFQSVFKVDPRQVHKYFLPLTTSPESIKNRYAKNEEDSYIEILFEDSPSDPRTKKISNTTVNTRTDKFVKQITLSSDFIDYKSVFNIYNFTNKERVKLFKYFEQHLMPSINLRTQLFEIDGTERDKNLAVWWDYLKKGMHPYSKIGTPEYISFQGLIKQFNSDFKYYLEGITETANEYLELKFKEKIRISFEYQDCTFNDFNSYNKGRNRVTVAPEIHLNVNLIDANLDVNSSKVDRAHTYLNEAKLSSIALAIRMAILRDKYVVESPKILVLDDLLLSLDMGNREAVLNIVLDEYCKDYQIIFLTHDRLFFQTVLSYIKTYHGNELRSSNSEASSNAMDVHFKKHWKIFEIYESALPDGKKIPVYMEYKSHLQKALHYFNNHDSIDYNACGNNLRAALEEFFIEFIPKEFLKDSSNKPIDKNSLTLNLLIDRCILFFNHVGFDTEHLDRINRYRERALNQTSHYNPQSNYFKNELQDTFEIINLLKSYRTESVVVDNELLQFTITSVLGKNYSYIFKPLGYIRLYLEPVEGATSFYCDLDKRIYGFVSFNDDVGTQPYNEVIKNKTLQEFYDLTFNKLENKIAESCNRETDIFSIIKNLEGKSLNDLKMY